MALPTPVPRAAAATPTQPMVPASRPSMGVKMVPSGGPRNSSAPTMVPAGSLATSTGEVARWNARSQLGKVASSKASTSSRSGAVWTRIDTPARSARSTAPGGAW
jgi:hypothetical protein